MSQDFRFVAVDRDRFAPLLDGREPLPAGARWLEVDAHPGFPCRVSLLDAAVGERVLALPFEHHPVDSPYRATGPIFIREEAVTAAPDINEVPEMFRQRQQSLRGYDDSAMMVAAEVVDGKSVDEAIRRMLGNDAVAYLHLHNAGPGCFSSVVERA